MIASGKALWSYEENSSTPKLFDFCFLKLSRANAGQQLR